MFETALVCLVLPLNSIAVLFRQGYLIGRSELLELPQIRVRIFEHGSVHVSLCCRVVCQEDACNSKDL